MLLNWDGSLILTSILVRHVQTHAEDDRRVRVGQSGVVELQIEGQVDVAGVSVLYRKQWR